MKLSPIEALVIGLLGVILLCQYFIVRDVRALSHETEYITFKTPKNEYYLQGRTITDLEGHFPPGGIVCLSRMEAIQFVREMQEMEIDRANYLPVHDYQVDIYDDGYAFFDDGDYDIGFIPYGECSVLDKIFNYDNR